MGFLHVFQVLVLLTEDAVCFALENSVVVAVGGHNSAGGGLLNAYLTRCFSSREVFLTD
jgi:hypothetical protein